MKDTTLHNDPILTDMVQRLVEVFQPIRIFLFGSRARDQSENDSDYDLMVIVSDSASTEQRRSRLAYEALRGTGTAADVLVWTKSRFESRLHLKASLPSTIIREGRLLYSA